MLFKSNFTSSMDNSNNKLEIREKKLEDLNNNRTIDQEKK